MDKGKNKTVAKKPSTDAAKAIKKAPVPLPLKGDDDLEALLQGVKRPREEPEDDEDDDALSPADKEAIDRKKKKRKLEKEKLKVRALSHVSSPPPLRAFSERLPPSSRPDLLKSTIIMVCFILLGVLKLPRIE